MSEKFNKIEDTKSGSEGVNEETLTKSEANKKVTRTDEIAVSVPNSSLYNYHYSCLKWIFYGEVWRLVREGRRGPLTLENMPLPFDYYDINKSLRKMDRLVNKYRQTKTFLKICGKTFKVPLLKIGVLLFFMSLVKLGLVLIIGKIIRLVTDYNLGEDIDKTEMILFTVALGIVIIVKVIIENTYWNYAQTMASKFRFTIVSLLYKKILSVALSSLQELNMGKVLNLISNDLNDVDVGILFLWPMLLSPVILALALLVLWFDYGYLALVGISGTVILNFIQTFINSKTVKPREKKNLITDERVKITNEIVDSVRLIKMYAWEKPFLKIVEKLRDSEYYAYMKLWVLDALGRNSSYLSVYICSYVLFIVYTAVKDDILNSSLVYQTMMILFFVRVWGVLFFHQGRFYYVNFKVISKRIEEILGVKEVVNQDLFNGNKEKAPLYQMHSPEPVIFNHYTGYWKENETKACLTDINMHIKPGTLVGIVGRIGSGKTSLLLSFVKEIPKFTGEHKFSGRVAYVEQEPLVFSGTVRSNVLFGLEYNESLYLKCLEACKLSDDLKLFPKGDMTLIGERGVTLSGGQKARVSLARALYSQSDIYLFDDPLAAVDAKVARHIFDNAIKGDLLKGKIVFLATHHLNFAKDADYLVLMNEGKIEAQGPSDEVINCLSAFWVSCDPKTKN